MGLKSLWAKPKKRIGTPKSNSLNFSINDSENSYKMEMLEVSNEAGAHSEPQQKPEAGSEGGEAAAPPAVEQPAPAEEAEAVSATEAQATTAEEPESTQGESEESDFASEIADFSEMSRLPQEPQRVIPVISGNQLQETPATTRRPRRSRATSAGTTPQPEDSYESQERKEREEAMIRLWRRATTPKKLPFPSRYPGYLKEPPELSYEETHASIRRRNYNDTRIKEYREAPFKRDDSKVKHLSPKGNRTVQLRSKFIRREPLVSQYFSQHFNIHKKPPFKNTNVKYYIDM